MPSSPVRLITAAILLCAIDAAHAQADPHRCATILDVAARVSCYDAIFGAPVPPGNGQPPPAQDAAKSSNAMGSAKSAAAAAASAPGTATTGASNTAPARDASKSGVESPDGDIQAVVTGLAKRRTGEYVYTLDNGQRWVQLEADTEGRLEPGATVTIKKAALGSHRLVSGTVATKVRRLQ